MFANHNLFAVKGSLLILSVRWKHKKMLSSEPLFRKTCLKNKELVDAANKVTTDER